MHADSQSPHICSRPSSGPVTFQVRQKGVIPPNGEEVRVPDVWDPVDTMLKCPSSIQRTCSRSWPQLLAPVPAPACVYNSSCDTELVPAVLFLHMTSTAHHLCLPRSLATEPRGAVRTSRAFRTTVNPCSKCQGSLSHQSCGPRWPELTRHHASLDQTITHSRTCCPAAQDPESQHTLAHHTSWSPSLLVGPSSLKEADKE